MATVPDSKEHEVVPNVPLIVPFSDPRRACRLRPAYGRSVLTSLLQQMVEWLSRNVAAAFSRPLDALRKAPPHTRTSTDDARIHLNDWIRHKPVQLAVLGAAIGGFVLVLVPTDLGLPWAPLAAALASALAAAAVPATAFVCFWITAPARQRDEARAALVRRPRVKATAQPRRPTRDPIRLTRLLQERRAERLRAEIQDELVAIIEQGRALNANAFDESGYGPFKLWQDKTALFIEVVLGPLESQRYREFYEPPPLAFSETVEHRLKRLAALRDRPDSWKPQVDIFVLRDACEQRRHVSQAELIVLAGDTGGAAQVPRRLDRAQLAESILKLAEAIEATLDGCQSAEQQGIAAIEERAAKVMPPPAEADIRNFAESRVASETRDSTLRKHGAALTELVDAAVDLGAVARLERPRYAEPDPEELRSLPDALSRVAKRLEDFEPATE